MEKMRFKVRLEGSEWAKWILGKSFQNRGKSTAKVLRQMYTCCVQESIGQGVGSGLQVVQGSESCAKDFGFCSG